jgi:hypothetical protein
MPFGFHLAMDTLPSRNCGAAAPGPPWSVSGFRLRARLGLSIPSTLPGPRGITPAFGYSAPHSSAGGTSTLPINALLSAHYEPLRLPARAVPSVMYSRGPLGRGLPSPPCRVSQVPRLICSCALVPNHPGRSGGCVAHCFPAGVRLHHLRQTGHLQQIASRGRIGFACATARRFASPVSTRPITRSRSGSATCTNEQFTW